MKLQKYSFGPMFPSSVFWIFKQKSVYKGLLLDLVEMVIFAFQGHQLFVVAALHNASVLDEQYRVSIADSAQTVCNDNGGMFFLRRASALPGRGTQIRCPKRMWPRPE